MADRGAGDPEGSAAAARAIPQDDWTDQDILTRAEAAQRLRAEIGVVERDRAALTGDAAGDAAGAAERALLDRRLAAIRAALGELGELGELND
jgi:hypothetical protein